MVWDKQKFKESKDFIAKNIGSIIRIIIFNILFDVRQHILPEVARAKKTMDLISPEISR
jgi:hypothetical protein